MYFQVHREQRGQGFPCQQPRGLTLPEVFMKLHSAPGSAPIPGLWPKSKQDSYPTSPISVCLRKNHGTVKPPGTDESKGVATTSTSPCALFLCCHHQEIACL